MIFYSQEQVGRVGLRSYHHNLSSAFVSDPISTALESSNGYPPKLIKYKGGEEALLSLLVPHSRLQISSLRKNNTLGYDGLTLGSLVVVLS